MIKQLQCKWKITRRAWPPINAGHNCNIKSKQISNLERDYSVQRCMAHGGKASKMHKVTMCQQFILDGINMKKMDLTYCTYISRNF